MAPREPHAVLIHPSTGGDAATSATLAGSEHLGLGYLGAALESSGVRTEIVDLQAAADDRSEVLDLVASGDVTFVGISPTSRSVGTTVDLMDDIRALDPECLVCWGGHLATALRAETFEYFPQVDLVCLGLAETFIGPLVVSLATAREVPAALPVIVNPRSRLGEGHPCGRGATWKELTPVRASTSEAYGAGARVITSLGCPYDCVFCTTPEFSGRRVDRRDAEHVIEEVAALQANCETSRIWLNDDLFVTRAPSSRAWTADFARSLHERLPSARFRPMVRADTFRDDPALLDLLVACGMDTVFVGIESGSAAGLDALNKRTTVDVNRWIVEELERRAVVLQPGFIMYSPGASIDTLRENASFLREVGELYRFFPLTRAVSIYPGTALWRASDAEGFDRARSDHVLRAPVFGDPVVTRMAAAYEIVEELVAPIDAILYRARGDRRLGREARSDIGELIEDVFLESLAIARSADTSAVVEAVMSRSDEVELLAREL
jgi:anaerobic magnesium-protoporphyrin IX monomethyl ester cyclase